MISLLDKKADFLGDNHRKIRYFYAYNENNKTPP